jgi:phospholipid-binding lipoprotein MlaA
LEDGGNNGQSDPYEATNRKLYDVSATLDKNAIRPATLAYRNATPSGVRTHLHDLLTNLANPAQFANDVFQGKPHKAGNTFMRLVINTTIGVGGVFDVASGLGYPDHSTDFGLTLALWGVPSGPYLFLPLLGPSNPRDGIAYGVNSVLSPFTWVSFGGSATLGYARFGVGHTPPIAAFISSTGRRRSRTH